MQHSVILYRIDTARNMLRFYCLDIQLDLFGNHCLLCMRGQIGKSGLVRSVPRPIKDDTQVAFNKQWAAKEWRGYAV